MAQTTSNLWKELLATAGTVREYQFDIDGTICGEDAEIEHSVEQTLFDELSIGNAISATLTLKLVADDIPRSATIKRSVRLRNGDTVSEWVPKGTFYTNRRSCDGDIWEITAYDGMCKAEQTYLPDVVTGDWPYPMKDAAADIAERMGVSIDGRTVINEGYMLQYPTDRTMRQVLGEIAAAHGGNWVMTDDNELYLLPLLGDGSEHEIGLDVTDFKDTGKLPPVSRVTLFLDDENYYTAGDDTGKEITASCPSATQAMADALLAKLSGYQHQTFTADAANLDPAAELGDAVSVGGVYAPMCYIKDNGRGYCDISAADEPEVEDEYPYLSPIQQALNRKSTEIYSQISKTAEEIKLEIVGLDDKYSNLTQTIDGFDARIQGAEDASAAATLAVDEFKVQLDGTIDEETAQSMIDQTLKDITLSVSDSEGSTTFTLKAGSTELSTDTFDLYVKAANIYGTLNANQINMTGAITWQDLDENTQSEIENAQSTASAADNNASSALSIANSANSTANGAYTAANGAQTNLALLANGQYQGGTFIDGKNLYAPNLYGNTISLMDGYGFQVGTMSLQQSSTFAFDLSSNLSLRLTAASGFNAYLGNDGAFFMCAYDATSGANLATIGGGMRLTPESYGYSLPTTGLQVGRVFFLLES